MNASMKSSLLGLGITVAVIPAISMFAFMAFMGFDVVKVANESFRNAVLESAKQSTIDIRQMCDAIELSDDAVSESTQLAIFQSIESLGKISLDTKPSTFTIYTSDSPDDKKTLYAPLLKFGDYVASPNIPTDSPDNKLAQKLSELKERLHCDISIFYKVPDSDLYVRIASTLTTTTGETFAGTYISTNKNLDTSILFKEMISSQMPVTGLITFDKIPYSANYYPLFTSSGDFIGAVYFGFPMPSVLELEKLLQSSFIGETGSVWVIDDLNRQQPVLRVSRDASAIGLKVSDDPLEARRVFLSGLIEKSRNMGSGELGIETIKIPAKSGKGEIVRLVTYTVYEPWRWIIGTSVDADEFSGSESALIGQIKIFMRKIIYAGGIFVLLAIGISWILASRLSKPLTLLRKVALFHSRGDMAQAESEIEAYSKKGGSKIKEFDELITAVSDMTRTLSALIKSIRADGETAAQGASKISTLAKSIEEIAVNEVVSMRRVATSGKSISLSADAINKSARLSASQILKTLDISRLGGETLQQLRRNYDALYSAVESISRRLSIINENAEKITAVATAIAEINKRTNILSLNASIEAEKAGGVGLGFAVVARQIRRLADKTSKSASDIESAVRQMQSSVNSGVMEMDRFGASMRQSLTIIFETADSLSRVVGDIEGIGPKFENIASRISALSENARKISDTMTELSENSVRARDTAMEFKTATLKLDSTSESLISEVLRFNVSEQEDKK